MEVTIRKIRAFVVAAVLAVFTMLPGGYEVAAGSNQQATVGCTSLDCALEEGCTTGTREICTILICIDNEIICYKYFEPM